VRAVLAAPLALFLALSACGGGKTEQDEAAAPAQPRPPCEAAVFEEVHLTLCTADPATDTIRTVLGPKDGKPWRSLAAYAASRPANAQPVAFALNGGMFDDSGQPIGYYVEDHERLHKLNRNRGPGNFHLLPNGVFYGANGKWEVRTSKDFFDHVTSRPDFGTQSGPMLVIDGELHPKLDPEGASLRIRDAVGIDSAGRAVFAISDDPISFGQLARFYRDVLKVRNALYLDGTVSSLWVPETGRLDSGFPLGPLIVVEKRAKAAAKEAP
jgi:uncharacterized protein YigE (DUF2233 family)